MVRERVPLVSASVPPVYAGVDEDSGEVTQVVRVQGPLAGGEEVRPMNGTHVPLLASLAANELPAVPAEPSSHWGDELDEPCFHATVFSSVGGAVGNARGTATWWR